MEHDKDCMCHLCLPGTERDKTTRQDKWPSRIYANIEMVLEGAVGGSWKVKRDDSHMHEMVSIHEFNTAIAAKEKEIERLKGEINSYELGARGFP